MQPVRMIRTGFGKVGMGLCALIFAVGANATAAQEYPAKPITMIVPFSAGGFNDVSGRLVADALTKSLGQPVVVENRTGAAGAVGASAVALAEPDGYTLGFLSSGPMASNVSLYKSLPYDPASDFAGISRVAISPNVLAVHPSLPVETLPELLQHLKEHPGEVRYGSSGDGSTPHLSAVLLESMADVSMRHIPYRGGSQTNTALLSNEIQLAFSPLLEMLPLINEGKLRPLGVTSEERADLLPDVPAIAETLPGYEVLIWSSIVAPAETPAEIVDLLNDAVRTALETSELSASLKELGLTPAGMEPAEFEDYAKSQIDAFAELVKMAGVEPQ